MQSKKGDAVAAIVLLALALAYTLEALRLPGVKYAVGPGPSFLPLLLGIALTALSLVLLVGTALSRTERAAEPSPVGWHAVWRIGVILVSLVGYALLFERLGYLVSTALFLAFLLAVVEPQRWWIVAGVPAVSSIFSYLLFVRWLKVPFPKGLLGF